MKKKLSIVSLFLCLFHISLGQHCQKNLSKVESRKNIKRVDHRGVCL